MYWFEFINKVWAKGLLFTKSSTDEIESDGVNTTIDETQTKANYSKGMP